MRLTERVHHDLAQVLQHGDCAIDATAGNGHDTLFLAQQVGIHGKVFAFDIQPTALEQTKLRLQEHQLLDGVQLYLSNHAHMAQHIPAHLHGSIRAITFNLGYLPGAEHHIQTQASDTEEALKQAVKLLAVDGILSILAYTGHEGGREEADRVQAWIQTQQPYFNIQQHIPKNTLKSPPEYTYMRKNSGYSMDVHFSEISSSG